MVYYYKKEAPVKQVVTLHQHYLYRGYLQIAALDLTRSNAPALWLLHWDPTQPVATRPLSIRKNGTWYTYGHDLTKNVTELYKADGTIATAYDYTPYGTVTATGIDQPIQWSSEHYDPELALVYYNYRHYNPLEGRWICRDFIHEYDGYHLYLFVNNNFISSFDIYGLMTVDDCKKNIETLKKEAFYLIFISKLKEGGCTFNIICQDCQGIFGYQEFNDKTKHSKVQISAVDHRTLGELRGTLKHELTHAYDSCTMKEPNSCDNFWLTEIRAYSYGQYPSNYKEKEKVIKTRVKNNILHNTTMPDSCKLTPEQSVNKAWIEFMKNQNNNPFK